MPRAAGRGPLRLIVALGDPAQERRLLPDLRAHGDLEVVARCLAAEQLLDRLRTAGADAALVAHDLHRLDADALGAAADAGVPLVLLAPAGEDGPWRGAGAVLLPPEADAAAVRAALAFAVE